MSRIVLVVSDVDGTLVTSDKQLTDGARLAVRRLHDANVEFTITSSRPPFGMKMFLEPLGITLPIGAFNGSSIVDRQLNAIEQHFIPLEAVKRSLQVFADFEVDVWLFTNDRWIIRRDDGKYVPHEQKTIQTEPTIVESFERFMPSVCKMVGASGDAARLERCETAMQRALGDQASAIRSQSYYLDVTPPGFDKGTFVDAMAKCLAISPKQIATIGDMRNDLAMFGKSGMPIAMGNATDEVKSHATHTTRSNESDGFAGAIDIILNHNAHS